MLVALSAGAGEKCESEMWKLRMFFLSCQERCVSQLWDENSSSLTELLYFKMVVNESSCVGPSVFLSSEVSLLMFLLTSVGLAAYRTHRCLPPLTINITARLPASDLFQKTKEAHEHLSLYIPFQCMRSWSLSCWQYNLLLPADFSLLGSLYI